ncbi:unnamed protein product [Tilletia caries]|nr:unnamed protein product [Tilletia caries]
MDVANDVASLSAVLASELELLCSGIEVCLDSDEANTLEVSIHLESIQEALEQLRYMADVLPPQDHDHASWYRGERNALTLPLDYDLLVELFELRFTDEEIAIFLNCSRRTVQRRRDDLSLSKREQADLSHEDLCQKAGWAILEGDAEVVGLGVLLRNFADYGAGVDDQGLRHEQRQHVPHVHIAALSDAIPPILQNETVQEELRQRLDSIWPPPEDMGIAVFQKALLLVNLLLQSHFNT